MPLPDRYATYSQLASYWKPLSAAEQTRATDLLGRAAALINEIPGAADADGEAAFSRAACEHVSLDMVKRALLSREDGVVETTATMADMTGTQKRINPVGNVYLTSQEITRLVNTLPGGPASPISSLTPASNVRVPCQPWNYQQSSQTD